MGKTCENCGKQIEPDRLKVLPGTEICSTCAHAANPKRAGWSFTAYMGTEKKPGAKTTRQEPERKTLRGKYGFSYAFSPLNPAGKKAAEEEWTAQYPTLSG